MSKSSGRSMFGQRSTGRRGGQITVIDMSVRRSWARKAQIAFFVTAGVVGVLTATVVSHSHHPIIGVLAGVVAGVVVGAVVAAFVFAWPVLRVFWHWSIEIGAAVGLVYGWTVLMESTALWLALPLVVVLFGVPAAFGSVRRRIVATVWCVIVRHRLRLCFTAFIHAAGSHEAGNPPLILWARPTPAGERVWVWLRPGLSLDDLEGRTDKIAVACWATTARVIRADGSQAALVRVDLTRRDPLLAKVRSPLVDMLPDDETDDAGTTVSRGTPPDIDLDLDLTDVDPVTAEKPKRGRASRTSKSSESADAEPFDEYEAFR